MLRTAAFVPCQQHKDCKCEPRSENRDADVCVKDTSPPVLINKCTELEQQASYRIGTIEWSHKVGVDAGHDCYLATLSLDHARSDCLQRACESIERGVDTQNPPK